MAKQNISKEAISSSKILEEAKKIEQEAKAEKAITEAKKYSLSSKNVQELYRAVQQASNDMELMSKHNFKYYGGGIARDKEMDLLNDITILKREMNDLSKQLSQEAADKEKIINEFTEKSLKLEAKERIKHILSRITEEAGNKILDDGDDFLQEFANERECKAVVVSIDIRRSTELMLKARTPKDFSKFITELSNLLSECIIRNLGIFDKFTGDGILAFFPTFYSGSLAIMRALQAAEECHAIFHKHYNDSRASFNVFIKDIGLGIGIDFGTVTLVNTRNELTVVGIPVVYACRMSGANAGETLLNHAAKEEIFECCDDKLTITETEIYIKNEGTAAAYKVNVHPSAYIDIPLPSWMMSDDEVKD